MAEEREPKADEYQAQIHAYLEGLSLANPLDSKAIEQGFKSVARIFYSAEFPGDVEEEEQENDAEDDPSPGHEDEK